MSHYFMAGSFRDTGSWHGMEVLTGGIFTGDVTIFEQMQRSDMDYDVIVSPSYFEWNGKKVVEPRRYHVLVPPTSWNAEPKSIRVIGNRYEVLQNTRVAELLEPLQKYYPLEGMGVLKDGKIIFVELKMEPFDVGGHPQETHKSYLLFSNDHTQGSAFLGQTIIRVVCNNTYSAALAEGELTSIPHSTDLDGELAFRTTVMQKAVEARLNNKHILNRMFVTPINSEQVSQVAVATFPDPNKPRALRVYNSADSLGLDHSHEAVSSMAKKAQAGAETWARAMDRQQELRTDVAEALFRFNDEQPYAANTAYALWNSVTEVVNHSPRWYGEDDKNMVSLYFGQKATMQKNAWDSINEIIL